jgi:hypothetical protein
MLVCEQIEPGPPIVLQNVFPGLAEIQAPLVLPTICLVANLRGFRWVSRYTETVTARVGNLDPKTWGPRKVTRASQDEYVLWVHRISDFHLPIAGDYVFEVRIEAPNEEPLVFGTMLTVSIASRRAN